MAGGSVLFFGDINVDNIFKLPEFPEPGRDGFATHTETHLGGAVCNSAVVCQRLGQAASLLGVVGEDLWSDYVFGELARAGINADHVFIKEGEKTGLIFIAVTPDGERTMLSYRGANLKVQPEDLPENVLDHVCLVQFSGYVFLESPQKETAWRLLELALDRGIPISLDTGLDPVVLAPKIIRKILPHLTLLITGEKEARLLTGRENYQDQIDAFLSLGLKQVAIKLGSRGALIGCENRVFQQPAFTVTVVDTTSAGDAFSAGLIYGYLNGLSPDTSLTLANALGGLATTVYGAAWIGREDVLSFLGNNQNIPNDPSLKSAVYEVIHHLKDG